MKKAIKIISGLVLVPLVLLNIYSVIIHTVYAIPPEMKKESVCFFAPDLTWDSTFSDLKKQFGEPVNNKEYNDDTGTVENTYKAEYYNHPMTVYATTSAFRITELFRKHRIFRYSFDIECKDKADAVAVFAELREEIIKSNALNKNFSCEKTENEFSCSIGYGPCWITYNIQHDKTDNQHRVWLYIDALY